MRSVVVILIAVNQIRFTGSHYHMVSVLLFTHVATNKPAASMASFTSLASLRRLTPLASFHLLHFTWRALPGKSHWQAPFHLLESRSHMHVSDTPCLGLTSQGRRHSTYQSLLDKEQTPQSLHFHSQSFCYHHTPELFIDLHLHYTDLTDSGHHPINWTP